MIDGIIIMLLILILICVCINNEYLTMQYIEKRRKNDSKASSNEEMETNQSRL
jgi:hypothetical protein